MYPGAPFDGLNLGVLAEAVKTEEQHEPLEGCHDWAPDHELRQLHRTAEVVDGFFRVPCQDSDDVFQSRWVPVLALSKK